MQPRSFLGLAKRSFGFWFGGIWLLVGAPFLIIGVAVGLRTIGEQERFKNEAQVTDGTVVDKWIGRKRQQDRSSSSHWVAYRYSAPNGPAVKREAEVSAEEWERLAQGKRIRVTYLRGDPATSRIEGETTAWVLPLIFTGFGLVFVPVGGFIFFKGVAGIRRELRLHSEGMSTQATVEEVEPTNYSFNEVTQWRIRYRYRDHQGLTHQGQSNLMQPEEAQAWKAGDEATVLFDTGAPEQSVWVGRQ